MTPDQITLFVIFAVVMALMLWGRWRYDIVAFAGLIAGVLTGIVPAEETFSGFANPATMTVALILIVTAGLQRSGVVAMLTRLLSGEKRSVPAHVAIMGGVGAAISGFMNNVAALAILMPIDIQTARKAGRRPALTPPGCHGHRRSCGSPMAPHARHRSPAVRRSASGTSPRRRRWPRRSRRHGTHPRTTAS